MKTKIVAIDLFCGIGGLTHGLIQSGINVVAGYDLDNTCRYAYEKNNKATFYTKDISEIDAETILNHFKNTNIKVLVGCAPCQPFSQHSNKIKNREGNKKWGLLYEFLRLINETSPDIISMENVPNLARQDIYDDFVNGLQEVGYKVTSNIVYCPDYGIPQKRKRLVLLASKMGSKINLIPKTHTKKEYKTTKDTIGYLPPISAGETSKTDKLHKAAGLTELNLKRIRQSKPKGTWRDWDEDLILACHKKASGKSYPSVYGRMAWTDPSPTITTQYYNIGTGRFGHPEQDRAISLREGALLQTFPKNYKFVKENNKIHFTKIARHIGNAVPVKLGKVIGLSILKYLENLEPKYHVN